MNHEQMRIAMNAYNKRMQLEEAYKEGHSDAVYEQGKRLGGYARQLKLMKSRYDARVVRAMQQKLKNTAYRTQVELISKLMSNLSGRKLTNKEKEKLIAYFIEKDILGKSPDSPFPDIDMP